MIWGFVFVAVCAAAIYRSDTFWEWLTGLSLLGTIVAVVQLDPVSVLVGLGLLGVCVWYWSKQPA